MKEEQQAALGTEPKLKEAEPNLDAMETGSVPQSASAEDEAPTSEMIEANDEDPHKRTDETEAETEPEPQTADASESALLSSRWKGISFVLKPWHGMVAVGVVMLLVVGGIFLGMQLSNGKGIDQEAVPYPWKPPVASDAAHAGISIPGYSSLTLPAGEAEVELILPNPSDNPCNFWFTLCLSETGEVLYQSGMIPPGMAVKTVRLTRALEAGDYTLVIRISTTAVSDGVPMNGATLSVPLQVR